MKQHDSMRPGVYLKAITALGTFGFSVSGLASKDLVSIVALVVALVIALK